MSQVIWLIPTVDSVSVYGLPMIVLAKADFPARPSPTIMILLLPHSVFPFWKDNAIFDVTSSFAVVSLLFLLSRFMPIALASSVSVVKFGTWL